MNLIRLERQLMADEGFRADPYQCSQGFFTIGFGARRLFCEEVTADTATVRHDQAQQQLRADIFKATLDMRELFPLYWQMNYLRQELLTNMAYQLGFTGLSKFRLLRHAASQLNYLGMSREMQQSLWYQQSGNRSKRMVRQMRTGKENGGLLSI